MSLDKPHATAERQAKPQYNERGLLERSSYDTHILPSLKENPELDISREDGAIIDQYLEKQSPEYRAELQDLIKDTSPLSPDTKLSIAVPAYKEGEHIYKTLEHYSKLENHDEFEIVILENHLNGTERDQTAANIARFKSEHPDMHITHLYKTFDEKKIGRVRKFLTDSILARKQAAGRKDSMIVASNDADLEDINPRYAKILIEAFENDPRLDAVSGSADYPTDAFVRFPLIHASLRFSQYFQIVQRRMEKDIRLHGRNTAFRSGIYAAVGGYNEEAKLAEDIELGRFMVEGRKGDLSRMKFIHNAWVHTNPRREIITLLNAKPQARRWDDFATNESIYDSTTLLDEQTEDFSPEDFKKEIQSVYDYYKSRTVEKGGWIPETTFNTSFDRAMKFMGMQYHVENDTVVVDDISKVLRDLDTFREKNAPTEIS